MHDMRGNMVVTAQNYTQCSLVRPITICQAYILRVLSNAHKVQLMVVNIKQQKVGSVKFLMVL